MLGLLGDVGTHMGSIGKQVITSSLPDWCWHWAQLVSRSHYYVIMLSDVETHMGLIGKQNLLQLCHHRCYVIRQFSPTTSSHTPPTHAPHTHTHTAHLPMPPTPATQCSLLFVFPFFLFYLLYVIVNVEL